MVTELDSLFGREVGFLCCLEMFFHLFYDMLRFSIILNFQVCGCLAHLMGMPADRAELPALEPINIGKCPASRAPDDEVHDNLVMCSILIKIYRQIGKETSQDPPCGVISRVGSLHERILNSAYYRSGVPVTGSPLFLAGVCTVANIPSFSVCRIPQFSSCRSRPGTFTH